MYCHEVIPSPPSTTSPTSSRPLETGVRADLEEMRGQQEKLSSSNKELRRKLRQGQAQMHCLVDERAELQVRSLFSYGYQINAKIDD